MINNINDEFNLVDAQIWSLIDELSELAARVADIRVAVKICNSVESKRLIKGGVNAEL